MKLCSSPPRPLSQVTLAGIQQLEFPPQNAMTAQSQPTDNPRTAVSGVWSRAVFYSQEIAISLNQGIPVALKAYHSGLLAAVGIYPLPNGYCAITCPGFPSDIVVLLAKALKGCPART